MSGYSFNPLLIFRGNTSTFNSPAQYATTQKELVLPQTKFETSDNVADSLLKKRDSAVTPVEEEGAITKWFINQRESAWNVIKEVHLPLDVPWDWDNPLDANFENILKPLGTRIGWAILGVTHIVVIVLAMFYMFNCYTKKAPLCWLDKKILVYAFGMLTSDICVLSALAFLLGVLSLIFRRNAFADAMPLLSLVADGTQTLCYDILAIIGFFLTKEYLLSFIPEEMADDWWIYRYRYVAYRIISRDADINFITLGFLVSTLTLGFFYLFRSMKTFRGILRFLANELFHKDKSISFNKPLNRQAYLYTGGPEVYEKSLLNLEKQLHSSVPQSEETPLFSPVYGVVHNTPWGEKRQYTFQMAAEVAI